MKEENIIEGGMYRLLETENTELNHWCRHNLLIASKNSEGEFLFTDTYWNGMGGYGIYWFYEIKDRIEFVFDMNYAKHVNRREWDEYEEIDKIYIPIGGREEKWILDDRAVKSKEKQILMLEYDIADLKHTIDSKQNRLELKTKELSVLKEEKVKQ